jgi:hypothetical protein
MKIKKSPIRTACFWIFYISAMGILWVLVTAILLLMHGDDSQWDKVETSVNTNGFELYSIRSTDSHWDKPPAESFVVSMAYNIISFPMGYVQQWDKPDVSSPTNPIYFQQGSASKSSVEYHIPTSKHSVLYLFAGIIINSIFWAFLFRYIFLYFRRDKITRTL